MININNTLNVDILANLPPAEKEYALKVLAELTSGKDDAYKKLLYADYKEIPVDIITFVKDDKYLGKAWYSDGKCKLFPYWENKLKELFPDNLTSNFNTAIFTGARGLGKSEIAITAGAYLMYRLMCLKDPFATLNLKPTEQVAFAFMNIKLDLAEEIGISKFQNTVQISPWFMERGTITGRTEKIWNPPPWIHIIIGSQSSDVIGQAVYFAFFDEISFIANQDIDKQKKKALDIIDTAIGGMKTRFTNRGKNPTLLILGSSKRSEKSFLESHIRKKQETDNLNTLVVDESVWNIRPESEYCGKKFPVALGNKFLQSLVLKPNEGIQPYMDRGYRILQVPVEYKEKFLEDIDRALCDYAGISSSEITTYISGERLSETKTDKFVNPFEKEILEVGNAQDDKTQYYNFFNMDKVPKEMMYKPLYIHLDMSISGDKTGIAGVWIKGKKPSVEGEPQSKELFYQLAFSVAIKAPKGHQISFEKNRQFIYWLKEKGFNIKGISSDSFQSADFGQALSSKNYPYKTISVDRVETNKICLPYQYFKSTIYENRIAIYSIGCDLLTEEIISLERNMNSGKVDHPANGCFTGDTKVSLVDGRALTFLELMEEFDAGKENWVYSFNETNQKIEPKRILKAWCTNKNQPLVKITLDNGEKIKCTYNHKFMLRDGSYMEAQNLLPFDSLMSIDNKIFKISDTNFINERADVYDITVEDNHNFALSAGIIVHNSKDISDAVCGSIYNASQNAEQFAYDYGEDIDTFIKASTDSNSLSDRQAIVVDFEQEIMSLFAPKTQFLNPQTNSPTNRNVNNEILAQQYLSNGIVVF